MNNVNDLIITAISLFVGGVFLRWFLKDDENRRKSIKDIRYTLVVGKKKNLILSVFMFICAIYFIVDLISHPGR